MGLHVSAQRGSLLLSNQGCGDLGCDRQLFGQPGPTVGGEGHSGEQCCPGSDLDSADSGHYARGKVANFGDDTPLGRAGQPAELAPVYVLLAADEGSYISGARVAVTGGRPVL